jgi:hypothetical protein
MNFDLHIFEAYNAQVKDALQKSQAFGSSPGKDDLVNNESRKKCVIPF